MWYYLILWCLNNNALLLIKKHQYPLYVWNRISILFSTLVRDEGPWCHQPNSAPRTTYTSLRITLGLNLLNLNNQKNMHNAYFLIFHFVRVKGMPKTAHICEMRWNHLQVHHINRFPYSISNFLKKNKIRFLFSSAHSLSWLRQQAYKKFSAWKDLL